jgi:mRNA-degrading endonuclease RelE of RelBE toxin-antitoxin system
MAKILEFTERFKDDYKDIPKKIQNMFNKKLELFAINPSHPSLYMHRYKMTKRKIIYEAYINESYRFTFELTKTSCILRNIGSHNIIDKGKVKPAI